MTLAAWVPRYIFGYLIYLAFILSIMTGATNSPVTLNIYDMTPEQQDIISSQETDILTWLNKVAVLGQLSSAYGLIQILTIILGIIWILAVAVAVNEFIPFT